MAQLFALLAASEPATVTAGRFVFGLGIFGSMLLIAGPTKVTINKRFINENEQRLLHTLQRYYATGQICRGRVLAEVALNRLLWFWSTSDRSRRSSWQNRVRGRSIDFLIVDPKSLRPIVAIGLDDKSHLTEKREQRDATVNTLCAGADL